jgi:hypothetical protein
MQPDNNHAFLTTEAMFSVGPLRDYISSTEENQIRMRTVGVQRSTTELEARILPVECPDDSESDSDL